MNQKAYKKSVFTVAILLLLSFIIALCAPINSYAAQSYNFALPTDIGYKEFSASDILDELFDIDEVEKLYLDAHNDFAIKYSDFIDVSYVNATQSADMLTVEAAPYEFGGLMWVPTSVNGDKEKQSGNIWTLDGNIDKDYITVEYESKVEVAAQDINVFINFCRDEAIKVIRKLESEEEYYKQELIEYNEKLSEYNRYLSELEKYNNDTEEYNKEYSDYISAYNAWMRAYAVYSAYLKDYEQYLKELDDYNNYDEILQKYYEDLARYQQYRVEYAVYEEKLEQYYKDVDSPEAQKALYLLSVLDYITKPVRLNRTISGAILGDAVTQVLGQTEALITAGAEAAAINRANDATIALRRLLNQYIGLKTDEERYFFYVGCYEQLRENFNTLLRTIDYLYGFQAVRGEIARRDRTEQFEILLAQLYYICNALDDRPVANYEQEYKNDKTGGAYFDSSYRIGPNRKTPASLVGENGVLLDKNDSLPLEGGYPDLPAKPSPPNEVANPGGVPQRRKPIEPDPVPNPGNAPSEPIAPTKPKAVAKPTAPSMYVPSAEEGALIDAYKNDRLKERALLKEDYTVTLKTTVVKYFRNITIGVRFFANKTDTLPLYTIERAERGSCVEYPFSVPTAQQKGYDLIFDYWQDEDGNRVDLIRLITDKPILNLYPHYAALPKSYSVVWVVNGKEIVDTCLYGSSPVYDEVKLGTPLVKPSDGLRSYRFAGWRDAQTGEIYTILPAMTDEGARYEAVFENNFIVNWQVGNYIIQTAVWGGEIPVFDGTPVKDADSLYCYTFVGWNKPLEAVYADTKYEAVFEKEYIFRHANGGAVVVLEDGVYTVNCATVYASNFYVGNLFALAASNNAAVCIRLLGNTLDLSASSVFEAYNHGVVKMTLQSISVTLLSYRYSVVFFDDGGTEIEPDTCRVSIAATGNFDKDNTYVISTDKNGINADVRYTINERTVTFTMRPGFTYDLLPMYGIGVIPSEYIEVSANLERAKAGEIVEITLGELPQGMYVRNVYIIDALGQEVLLDGNSFEMPNMSVTIGVICDYYEFTIVFKSDGKTLIARKLKYGETILPPPDPIKADDGVYRYTFVGWDMELGTVTGDAVFNAIFTKSLLPKEQIQDTKLNKLIRAMRIVLPIVFVLIAALIVLFIVRKVKKSKAAGARRNSGGSDSDK